MKKPGELRVLAFDPDTERIVSLTIPFWLLRLKMGSTRFELGEGHAAPALGDVLARAVDDAGEDAHAAVWLSAT